MSHLIIATMPAIIKTHQKIINIQPKLPKGPNPKFIISFVELLPKGDDHPPIIICIIGIKPVPCDGNAAEVSQSLLRLPQAICICSSPCSSIILFIISFIAMCLEVSPMDWPIKYSPIFSKSASLSCEQVTALLFKLSKNCLPSCSSCCWLCRAALLEDELGKPIIPWAKEKAGKA